ncbi:MAG: hypothetical protein RJA10_4665 [Pseudomonadota bacterium]|jgi:hypothetical protein
MMAPDGLLLAAKVALVALVVLLATQAARRFGHGVGGLLAGLPMIAAPITGLLLLQLPPERVRGVCLATLVCQPALIAYLVTYAHAAGRLRRPRWPVCLALSLGVFAAMGLALLALQLPPAASVAGAVAAPFLGWRLMPARRGPTGPTGALPRSELAARIAVAMAVAAGVLWGAEHLSAGLAGLLLAAPITGIVLPSFTLPRHGAAATQALLAGFIRGQAGFVAFFVLMVGALPVLPPGVAWGAALAAAALLPWLVGRWRR